MQCTGLSTKKNKIEVFKEQSILFKMFCSIYLIYLQDSVFCFSKIAILETPKKFFTQASEPLATALLTTKEIRPNKRVIILFIYIQT